MLKDELVDNSNNSLGSRSVKIKKIKNHNGYLFIILGNEQKILTNGKEIYNISNYENFIDVFPMGDKICAVLTKNYTQYLVDLKSMTVLFEDSKAYNITKNDERSLHVIMKIGAGNNRIYDIENKRYLPSPMDYKFESSLGRGLYVFREQEKSGKNFYEYKRTVINVDGKILLTDIKGWIYLSKNHLIIVEEDGLSIVGENNKTFIEKKTLKENETVIAKPQYYKGNIVMVERDSVKIYNPNLDLLKTIQIDSLDEILDLELIGDVLKLLLPYSINKQEINKHMFINLESDNIVSHLHIENYPYWNPTTFIGHDCPDLKYIQHNNELQPTNFHFYDHEFNNIATITGNSYQVVDNNKESIFLIRTNTNSGEKRLLFNANDGIIREVEYDWIRYHRSMPYGYGANSSKGQMDFFDYNLEVIIPNFKYQKYNLSLELGGFDYFIIKDYICIFKHYIDKYGKSQWRTVIQKANGEEILDSTKHRCYAIGNSIQIVSNDESQFLNIVTGEITTLELNLPTTENGDIDFDNLNHFNDVLGIDPASIPILPTADEPTIDAKILKPKL